MKHFVILMRLTDKPAVMPGLPERIEEWLTDWQDNCGVVHAFRMVLGECDFVLVGDAPDDNYAAAFCLRRSADVSTTTMHAFTQEEVPGVVAESVRPSGRGRTV